MKKELMISFVLSSLLIASIGLATIPEYITLQGRLTDTSNNPLDGLYDFDLEIYDASSGGTLIWSETQNNVNVTSGIFNILLGNVQTLDEDFDEEYWIEISVESSTLSPRVRLTSAPYAYYARNASFADETGDPGIECSDCDSRFLNSCDDCDSRFVNTITDKMTGNLTIDVAKAENKYGLNVTMYATPAGTYYGGWFACTGGSNHCRALYAYAPTGQALYIDGRSRFEDSVSINAGQLIMGGVPGNTMLSVTQAAGSYYAARITGGAGVYLDDTLVNGNLNVTGNIYYDGTLNNYHMYESGINLVKSNVEAGDLLVISSDYDSSAEISSEKYDTRIFGAALENTKSGEEVGVVILGRFPIKVTTENGPIQRGDMLTTSSKEGYAMKCIDKIRCVGAVIGKALEPIETSEGKINVMISPQ